ncbi:unnamed protein product [Sphagnum balticum]
MRVTTHGGRGANRVTLPSPLPMEPVSMMGYSRCHKVCPANYDGRNSLPLLFSHTAPNEGGGGGGGGFGWYRECQKNHAASLGSHALDGCGEFISSAPEEEGSVDALKCAACGCHRNFHRREVEAEILCDCHKSTSYPSSLTQFHGKPINPLAMAMSTGAAATDSDEHEAAGAGAGAGGIGGGGGGISSSPASTSMQKKRFRTKFSTEQKDEMCNFAEKLGWKMQKHDEAAVQEFCATVGVKRHVLKVWMHNNKHTMAKKT